MLHLFSLISTPSIPNLQNHTNLLGIFFDRRTRLIPKAFSSCFDTLIAGGGSIFEPWMSLLETPGGVNQLSYKTLDRIVKLAYKPNEVLHVHPAGPEPTTLPSIHIIRGGHAIWAKAHWHEYLKSIPYSANAIYNKSLDLH